MSSMKLGRRLLQGMQSLKMNSAGKLCSILVLTALVLFAPKTSKAVSTSHVAVYQGIGTTYVAESSSITISAASLLLGSNFTFVSYNETDATYSGNNVRGFLKYLDASNNPVVIYGVASRPVKSGNTVQGVYFYQADSTQADPETPTGMAYLIVFPNFASAFPGTGSIGTSSDAVDKALNSLLAPITPGEIGYNQTICAGATPSYFTSIVNATSTSASFNYQWQKSTDNISFSNISGATDSIYTSGALIATTYFRREVTDAGSNTAYSDTITVTVNPAPSTPTISAGGPTSFCSPGSVVLTASSASSYEWYKDGVAISGATNQTYTANASGTYTVKVTNASGCLSSASAGTVVTVNALPSTPTIGAGGPTTFCIGGSVTLTASSASTYAWYKDNVLISGATSQTYSATTTGSYTVVVTNASGCTSSASAGTSVTVNALPSTPTIGAGGPTTFCAGGSVVLTASSASAYAWYKDNVLISGATSQTYTANTTGSYTVVVSNGSGCISSASAGTSVTVNALPSTPTIGAGGPTTFCAGGNVVLTASSATTYKWYKDNVLISGATSQTYTANATGSYTVVVTNASGCTSSASAGTSVTVNALPSTPTITAGSATTFCAGGNVVLTASSATTYAWYKDNVLISGATSQTYTANATGSYTVVVTNASGCTSSASAGTSVTVNALPSTPTISAGGPTTFCDGGNVVLTASSATTYKWYKDNGSTVIATTQTYTATTSGSYTVVVTNASGCTSSASAGTTVTVYPIPSTPGAITGITSTYATRTNTYSVAAVSGATSYVWTLPSGWSGTSSTNSINVTAGSSSGTISVAAVANGCTSPAASLAITLKLFISDVMTPNGDGKNDKWKVVKPSNLTIIATIYNRWGQVVFKSNDYNSEFDGTGNGNFLGKQLPTGTYFYLLDITDRTSGTKSVEKGSLTLKRDY